MTAARLEQASTEITRRRALATAATPGPWRHTANGWVIYEDGDVARALARDVDGERDPREAEHDARHIAACDPTHVLAALDAAAAVLDRHAPYRTAVMTRDWCRVCAGDDWPCPDAAAVLDLYAPQETP